MISGVTIFVFALVGCSSSFTLFYRKKVIDIIDFFFAFFCAYLLLKFESVKLSFSSCNFLYRIHPARFNHQFSEIWSKKKINIKIWIEKICGQLLKFAVQIPHIWIFSMEKYLIFAVFRGLYSLQPNKLSTVSNPGYLPSRRLFQCIPLPNCVRCLLSNWLWQPNVLAFIARKTNLF